MKKYIGKLVITAVAMSYVAAYKNGLIPQESYNPEWDEKEGYKVVFGDESAHWCPKKTFETLYTIADTPLDRVNIEVKELGERIEKLGCFIFNDNEGKDYQSLPLGTRAFLLAQFHVMGSYHKLLSLRQSCMEGKVECRPWGLCFEEVLPLLKEGYALRRNGWNGKGLMVFKQVPSHITSDIIPNMQSLPGEAKRLILAHGDHIDYECQCLIFDPQTGKANSWVPSISDVFATDWELVME